MPLNKFNTRVFHRTLYASQLSKVKLLKRGNDQKQGTVTEHTLYQCRWSSVSKGGEPLQGDMSTDHHITIFIPRTELDRVGVAYINATDRFVDHKNRTWQPEAVNQRIDVKLFENRVTIECIRTDPPGQLN